jgi:hypothetical protein
MSLRLAILAAVVAALVSLPSTAQVTTAFTYQGELEQSGAPATGDYDFEFRLYDMQTGGSQVAGVVSASDVFVDGGLFNVELDFGNVFGLDELWLDVRVREGTSGGGFTSLLPRQRITPAPIALSAQSVAPGTVGSAQIVDGSVGGSDIDAGEVQARVTGTCPSGEAIASIGASGAVTCNAGVGGSAAWSLSGNAISGGLFLGTTNAEPLEFRVASERVVRLLDGRAGPISDKHAPNVVIGASENEVDAQVAGASVLGGGATDWRICGIFGGASCRNSASGDFSTVMGGRGNRASGLASVAMGDSVQAVGSYSTALGFGSFASGRFSLAGGNRTEALGRAATALGDFSRAILDNAIAIGRNADAEGEAAVALGADTSATGFESFAGGSDTTASGDFSTALGAGSAAAGPSSTALGLNTDAVGSASLATGFSSNAVGAAATAMGHSTTAEGDAAMAVNEDTDAGGDSSFAAGRNVRVRDAVSANETDGSGNCTASVGRCGDEGVFIWGDSQNVTTTSTAPDQFLIRARGGVGIGTNAPRNQLDVRRTSTGGALNANHVAVIENEATDNGHVLALKSNTNTPGSDENFITFKSALANVGAIEGDGSGGITMTSSGADFAELMPVRADSAMPRPGDVVGVIDGRIGLDTRGAQQLMVVSTQPIVIGNAPGGERQEGHVPVAFVGQVPVRVRGTVAPGDLLVASGEGDGRAVAIDRDRWDPTIHGPVVGQAWSEADGGIDSTIKAVVGVGQAVAAEHALRRQQAVIRWQSDRIERLEARFEAMETRLRQLTGQGPGIIATAAD